jgi:hypothetical protein
MITQKGYSKNPGILPEGIAITFGKEMMLEQGGVKNFLRNFQSFMASHEDGEYWMHKCSNLPAQDIDIIYIIVLNRLWGKVYNGGYHRYNESSIKTGYSADGKEKVINWNYIVLSGPFVKCPFKRELKGFQGFRYTTKLF